MCIRDSGRIHLGAKFLSICGPVKLENELFTPKIEWWASQEIMVRDALLPKGKKWEGERNHQFPTVLKFY